MTEQTADTGETVLSCPACWSWQLHYTGWVALQWPPAVFDALVEELLREHVASECSHPMLFMQLAKAAGKVGPHSRACGFRVHPHGSGCHRSCPTCGGS